MLKTLAIKKESTLVETVGGALVWLKPLKDNSDRFMITEASPIPFQHNHNLLENVSFLTKDTAANATGFAYEPGELVIAGKVQAHDDLNQNGRVYPKHILNREVEKYQKLIKEKRSIGSLDHPEDLIIEWETVSHRFLKLWWENNDLMAHIKVLKGFPKGKILEAAHKEGIPIGFSSRGMGSVSERGGKAIVNDDYQLVCWDAVTDPSTVNAFATETISESKVQRPGKSEIERLVDSILG